MKYLNTKKSATALLAILLAYPSQSHCGIGEAFVAFIGMIALGATSTVVGGIAITNKNASDAAQHTRTLEQRVAELEAQLGKQPIATKPSINALECPQTPQSFLPWTNKIDTDNRTKLVKTVVPLATIAATLATLTIIVDIMAYMKYKEAYNRNLKSEYTDYYYPNLKNIALENMQSTMTYKLIQIFKKIRSLRQTKFTQQ